jgi:hypothetical protein
MRKVFDKESFIKKANQLFDSKFDYEQFEYVNAKTKSIVVCPIHGAFEQSPDKHLNSKYGCYACAKKESAVGRKPTCQRESVSKEDYLQRFRDKYSDKFMLDLSDYKSLTEGTVKLVCAAHGETTYNPRSLLISKHGCKDCARDWIDESKAKPYEEFLSKVNDLFDGFYSYSKENEASYKDRKSIIEVICPKHGAFKKKAQKHLSGQGCFQCRIEKLVEDGRLPGGYSDKLFKTNSRLKEKTGYVYYLKVGNLYKIGITTDLNSRLRSIKSESKKNVEVIDTLETSLFNAYQLEQFILSEYDDSRTYRIWSTELFTHDILAGKSLKEL